MTAEKTNACRRLRAPLTAMAAALALAGCAAAHVGEDWQCPLAQGTQCASVAAADPAVTLVPETLAPVTRVPVKDADTRRPARPAPRRQAEDAVRSAEDAGTGGDCARSCNPFAWIAGLFDGGDSGKNGGADDPPKTVGDAGPEARQQPETSPKASAGDTRGDRRAEDTRAGESLRTPETIGRIWIAPWVDDNGVYREAGYVRMVIAPAAWRRP